MKLNKYKLKYKPTAEDLVRNGFIESKAIGYSTDRGFYKAFYFEDLITLYVSITDDFEFENDRNIVVMDEETTSVYTPIYNDLYYKDSNKRNDYISNLVKQYNSSLDTIDFLTVEQRVEEMAVTNIEEHERIISQRKIRKRKKKEKKNEFISQRSILEEGV